MTAIPSLRHPILKTLAPAQVAQVHADDARFQAGLDYVRTHAAGEVAGVYGSQSMTWQLYREPAIMLGGLRAIILQMAHPAIAAGVNQSSDFRNDILGRARRTYTAMYQLIFGDLRSSIGAAKRLHNLHTRVRGIVENDTAAPSANQPYRANDPTLGLWVLATLFDTGFIVYEQLFRPISKAEKAQSYREMFLSAALFGIPLDIVPPTVEDFYIYYNEMLGSSSLAVGPTCRELVRILFDSPYTTSPLTTITLGTLPPRFREEWGLAWDCAAQRRYERTMALLRCTLRLIPPALRAAPAYHQAQLRLARSQGKKGSLYARALQGLNAKVDVPLSLIHYRGG